MAQRLIKQPNGTYIIRDSKDIKKRTLNKGTKYETQVRDRQAENAFIRGNPGYNPNQVINGTSGLNRKGQRVDTSGNVLGTGRDRRMDKYDPNSRNDARSFQQTNQPTNQPTVQQTREANSIATRMTGSSTASKVRQALAKNDKNLVGSAFLQAGSQPMPPKRTDYESSSDYQQAQEQYQQDLTAYNQKVKQVEGDAAKTQVSNQDALWNEFFGLQDQQDAPLDPNAQDEINDLERQMQEEQKKELKGLEDIIAEERTSNQESIQDQRDVVQNQALSLAGKYFGGAEGVLNTSGAALGARGKEEAEKRIARQERRFNLRIGEMEQDVEDFRTAGENAIADIIEQRIAQKRAEMGVTRESKIKDIELLIEAGALSDMSDTALAALASTGEVEYDTLLALKADEIRRENEEKKVGKSRAELEDLVARGEATVEEETALLNLQKLQDEQKKRMYEMENPDYAFTNIEGVLYRTNKRTGIAERVTEMTPQQELELQAKQLDNLKKMQELEGRLSPAEELQLQKLQLEVDEKKIDIAGKIAENSKTGIYVNDDGTISAGDALPGRKQCGAYVNDTLGLTGIERMGDSIESKMDSPNFKKKEEGGVPQVGGYFVRTGNQYGHVGIITAVTNEGYYVTDYNSKGNGERDDRLIPYGSEEDQKIVGFGAVQRRESPITSLAQSYVDAYNSGQASYTEQLTKIGSSKENAPLRNEFARLVSEQGSKRVVPVDSKMVVDTDRLIDNLETLLKDDNWQKISGRAQGGLLGTGIGRDYISPATADVFALLENISGSSALKALIEAKADGATFGALSNQELNVLGSSANNLTSRIVKDQETGRIKRVSGSEESVKRDIENLLAEMKTKREKMINPNGNDYSFLDQEFEAGNVADMDTILSDL